MAENSKMSPAQKFDLANRNFKTVFRDRQRPHWMKYRYLHNWTLQKSKYLLDDERSYHGNKKVYRRGAIVNVDFGINVGTELSGNHFAIVLNKDDAPVNDKLTVIPLTSHHHPHTVKLVNTIREKARNIFFRQQVDFIALYAALLYLREQVLGVPTRDEMNYRKFLENLTDYMGPKEQRPILKKVPDFIEKTLINPEKARIFVMAVSPKIKGNDDPLSVAFLQSVQKAISDATFVRDQYLKYDKTTFAKVLDITTVSKSRLRKINPYDPIGDIVADNQTLDAIDHELRSLFTRSK